MSDQTNWSDGESNPDLLNAIQQTRRDTSQAILPTQIEFGEMTLAEAFELRDLLDRRRELSGAIPFAGNRVTAPRGRLLKIVLETELGRVEARIVELQAKRQAVAHG